MISVETDQMEKREMRRKIKERKKEGIPTDEQKVL